jgi:arginine/lysine/ornithine decarboxylase
MRAGQATGQFSGSGCQDAPFLVSWGQTEGGFPMEHTDRTSLLERLKAHRDGGFLSLHMPGHKENAALAPYLADLSAGLDITELPGFDDLHAPEGILAESMARASALFGSGESLYQVNGSTGALLAAIRGATRRGDRVLTARNCHKAVYHALELCGLEPVFLLPEPEETFGLAGSLSPAEVAAALEDHPDVRLVIYPSPTYDGVLSDTAAICAAAHARGVPVLVDEAHGAHLGLTREFPPGAVAQGADLVAASFHKMLPSLTQTAVLHVSGDLVDRREIRRQAGIFQSSSPSYLLMAAMDGCVRLLEERREALFAAWARRLREFDEAAAGLKRLRLMGHGDEAGRTYPGVFALDPAKILISVRDSALTGVELMERLRAEDRIELEMALDGYAVAMTGLGTGDAMPRRLAEALRRLDQAWGPAGGPDRPAVPLRSLPPRRLAMEEAARARGTELPLGEAAGRISCEYIWAYPPGIPMVVPGEEITEELRETVTRLHGAGVKLVGTRGRPPVSAVVL